MNSLRTKYFTMKYLEISFKVKTLSVIFHETLHLFFNHVFKTLKLLMLIVHDYRHLPLTGLITDKILT